MGSDRRLGCRTYRDCNSDRSDPANRARGSDRAELLRLEEEYESPEFRKVRKSAASYFYGRTSMLANDDHEQGAIRLLNFFEKVGFLFEKKVITVDAVWHFF